MARVRTRKSAQLKKYVSLLHQSGVPMSQLSSTELVSRSVGYRASAEVKASGTVKEAIKSTGRPSKASLQEKSWIFSLIRHQPVWYLDELAFLLARFSNDPDATPVHKSTVSKWLSAAKITHKTLTRAARQRDEYRRGMFSLRISQYTSEQLVFGDETHINARNALRTTGWAPRGERADIQSDFGRGGRWSLLPALSIDGLIAPMIVEGSITKERFLLWLEYFLLPTMNPFPGRNSILVLDNASVHKSQEALDLMEAAGK
ncbi:unnamed protein product [Tilletia controversa]|nr:unnamed protein product [Tilletia controversa]